MSEYAAMVLRIWEYFQPSNVIRLGSWIERPSESAVGVLEEQVLLEVEAGMKFSILSRSRYRHRGVAINATELSTGHDVELLCLTALGPEVLKCP